MQQVAEALNAEVLNGSNHLVNPIADVIIGAMTPTHCLSYAWDKTLLIVPGDRDDVVLAAVTMVLLRKDVNLSGILFTRGLQPQPETMDLVCRTDIPVLRVDSDTYEAAACTHDVLVKIRVADSEKINLATRLVREHVDLDRLWSLLA